MPEQMTKQDAIEYLLYMKHDVQAKSPMDIALDTAIEALKQPTVEAEPVRHGRWNYRHEDDWCYCTACGTDAEGSDGECLETDYCPHCGARMDGGADNA